MASNCGHELFEFRNTRNKIIEHGVSVAAIYREMRYIAIKPLYRETRYIAINIYSFRGEFHHTCLRESAQLNRLKRQIRVNQKKSRVKSRMPVIW